MTEKTIDPPEGWEIVEGKLHREFAFSDFAEAWKFMNCVAELAEAADHHPDWSNVYNRVVIDLVTHSLGRVSEQDMALAEAINGVEGFSSRVSN